MKGLALLLVLGGAVAAGLYVFVFDRETAASGSAQITSVEAGFTGSSTIAVAVAVEATAPMPPVGPHVIVHARCDDATDEVIGDVGLMNAAPAGEQRTDTVELFARAPFSAEPLRCEITARTSDGASRAQACIELGKPRAGGC